MTTIEVRPPGGSYAAIDYGEFRIEHGTSDQLLAPTASVESIRGQSVDVGDDLRITAADGTTQFVGSIEATPIEAGQGAASLRIEAKHAAYRLFDEEISVTESTPTDDEAVLSAALSAATEGGSFTLDYAGSPTALANAYDIEDRPVKRVFRDMVEKTGRVWWIGVDNTIHVEPRGARGVVATVNTATDDAAVSSYDPADVDTVINDVTVTGTGDVAVSASATDSNSISTYGPRSESVNYEFITTQSEASDLASALLQPIPLASAEATLTRSVADTRLPLVNYELDITDTQGTTLDDTLTVQSQTVFEGYATVELGEGAGVNIARYNRRQKSADDKTPPGTARIADGSISEPKLQDLAVSIDKIRDDAVTNPKVAADAIQETEIKDDEITTPKLTTGAITTNKLDVGAVTAQIIDTDAVEAGKIAADVVGARELIANTITADEIDTLDLDTSTLSVGTTNTNGGIEFGIITGTPFGDIAVMEPTADQAASIGQPNNTFYEGHFGSLFFASATWDPGTAPSVFFDFDTNFNSNIYPETEDSRLGTTSNRWGRVLAADADITNIALGDAADTQITTEPGVVGVELLPATDGDCKVGNGNFQFDEIHAEQFISDGSEITSGGGGGGGDATFDSVTVEDPAGTTAQDIILRHDGNGLPEIITGPSDGGQVGFVGTSGNPWFEMYAGSFNTVTPDPDLSVAFDDILGYDWRQPPEYLTRKETRTHGEYRRRNPAEYGIDLGHAANYLFEVTKAQSETITEQADRIGDLEAETESLRETVADLEARLDALESGANA